jgi:hypothetical protein
VSVKDRWVDPHKQVLNVPISCRWYGPGKPSSLTSTTGDFTPTASMAGSREKLSTYLWIGQPSCCGLCRELFFLRSSGSVHRCWWLRKMLLCVDHVRYVWSRTICGLSVGCVWCVGRVFPYRVYIDSNCCDSRIWVPLVCGSHHVDNLRNLMSLLVIDVCVA